MKFMIKEGKDWKLNAQEQSKKIWKGKPMTCPIWFDVKVFLKRERDLAGGLKVVADSFQGIVYEDDKQITEMTLHKEFDKENPRLEIKVESL
jgi:Holliday junction resolvase RusA-like endonuclease